MLSLTMGDIGISNHVGSHAQRTYFCNITVKRKRVRDAENEKYNYSPPVCKKAEHGYRVKRRKYRGKDVWYRVANDDAERDHATKCTK